MSALRSWTTSSCSSKLNTMDVRRCQTCTMFSVDSTATKSKHWKIIRIVIFHSVLYHVDQNWSDSYWLAGYFLQRLIIRVYNWLVFSTLPRFHCWDSFTVLSFQAQFIYHILSSHFSCICGMSGSLEERKTWFSRRVWVNFLRLNPLICGKIWKENIFNKKPKGWVHQDFEKSVNIGKSLFRKTVELWIYWPMVSSVFRQICSLRFWQLGKDRSECWYAPPRSP